MENESLKQAAEMLFDSYFEQSISEENAAVLLDLLQAYPTLRKAFEWEQQADFLIRCTAARQQRFPYPVSESSLDFDRLVALARHSSAASGPTLPDARQRPEPAGKWSRDIAILRGYAERTIPRITMAVVLFLAVGLLVGGLYSYLRPTERSSKKLVAHLIDASRARWDDLVVAPERGGPIHTGTLKLLEGVAAFKLIDGAEIVLEAPAEIVFEDASKLKLIDGYLSADVPPQPRALVIGTPQMDIKVLGTSFWLHADQTKTDVHLLRGKLELSSPTLPSFQLLENEAFSLPTLGDSKRFHALLDAFVPVAKIARRSDELTSTQYEKWKSLGPSLNDRSDLLLRFDFEQTVGDRLSNLAEADNAKPLAARIIGCPSCEGRWPGKKALKFNARNNAVILDVPGAFRRLTLVASIRVDSLAGAYSGILMSDAANSKQGLGRIQWQLMDDGAIRVGMVPQGDGPLLSVTSPRVFKPGNTGNWMQLAVVFDVDQGTVVQYANGRRVATGKMPEGFTPEIGSALLGGWRNADADTIERGFDGAIDELMIFDAALTAEQIRKLGD